MTGEKGTHRPRAFVPIWGHSKDPPKPRASWAWLGLWCSSEGKRQVRAGDEAFWPRVDGLSQGGASKLALYGLDILRMKQMKEMIMVHVIKLPFHDFTLTVQLLHYFICLLCMILKSNKTPFKRSFVKIIFFFSFWLLWINFLEENSFVQYSFWKYAHISL